MRAHTRLALVATVAAIAVVAVVATAADPPAGTKVYVAVTDADRVSVVDGVTGSLVASDIDVGNEPRGIVVAPDRSAVYVVNRFGASSINAGGLAPGTPSITVIDPTTDTAVDEIAVTGTEPYNLAITPDGTRLYVVAKASSIVCVVDTATRTETATIPLASVGASPEGIAILPNGTKAYVVNRQTANVEVVLTASNTLSGAPIAVGTAPRDAAASADGSRVIVVGEAGARIIDTSTDTVVATMTYVGNQRDVAVVGNLAYVTNFSNNSAEIPAGSVFSTGDSTLDVYDLAAGTYVAAIRIGDQQSYAVAVAPDGSRGWVTDVNGAALYAVDLAARAVLTVPAPTDLSNGPRGVAVLVPAGPEVLVDAYMLPTRVKVRFAGDGKDSLIASGVFDQGSGSLDGSADVTLEIGLFSRTFALERKGNSYFAPAESGVSFKVTPSRVGSSRGKFRLKIKNATLGGLVVPDGEVRFRFLGPDGHEVIGTIVTQGGEYRFARVQGTLVAPLFAPNRLTANRKTGAKDTLSFRGGFASGGAVPEALGPVRIEMGAYARTFDGGSFTKKGAKFTFKEKVGPAKASVVIDFAKERITVGLKGIELGPLDTDTVDLVVGTGGSDESVRSRLRLGTKGRKRIY